MTGEEFQTENPSTTMLAVIPPILIVVIAVGLVVFCLLDLARAQEVGYLPKWAWVLIIDFTNILGSIAYLNYGWPPDRSRL